MAEYFTGEWPAPPPPEEITAESTTPCQHGSRGYCVACYFQAYRVLHRERILQQAKELRDKRRNRRLSQQGGAVGQLRKRAPAATVAQPRRSDAKKWAEEWREERKDPVFKELDRLIAEGRGNEERR